jgi:hypothetical protein
VYESCNTAWTQNLWHGLLLISMTTSPFRNLHLQIRHRLWTQVNSLKE